GHERSRGADLGTARGLARRIDGRIAAAAVRAGPLCPGPRDASATKRRGNSMTHTAIAAPLRWLPLRLAVRELRSGLRGFYVFIACIALGVMAIAGVGSLATSLSEGLTREGRTLLGG